MGEEKRKVTGGGFVQQDERRKICVDSLLSVIRF